MNMLDYEQIAGNAHIAAVAVATPPLSLQQAEAGRYLAERYSETLNSRSLSLMQSLFSNNAILKRSFAIKEPDDLFTEDPDGRIRRFTRWAVDLSAEAIEKALVLAGAVRSDVSGLVVNTCTGYICPGISTYLIERLGLDRTIRAYDLVGSGCGGALPNLEVAESLLVRAPDKVVVSASVEICTATFQMGNDLSLLVSNALFGDGAAAAVLWRRTQGLQLIASSSWYVPEDRDAIRYVHKEGQLYNQLSTRLPHLVKKAVAQVLRDLLGPRNLRVADIKHWAFHTGGEKIINCIRDEIGLSEEQLLPTRSILSAYGNMSSPTVWFVLNDILDKGMDHGDFCVMVAFGAGLSAHAVLLKKHS
jgi:predicted naringenin-chalcone synthase